ncbi:MAG: FtsW/RodA/SpoVE family cell cycle protein [Eubacteriales bacterium]|nr:FtsW/RodA/SpoVE family cell cycle protein [Eubacteriales bacterium]
MVSIVIQISKYLLLALMIFFTLETFMVLRRRDEEARRRIMRKQIGLMVLFNIVCYLVMYLKAADPLMLIMLLSVIGYILIVQILYRLIYQKASLILLNTMCMLLSVGLVIQTRLGVDNARKQFIIVAASTLICFIIPVFIRRVRIVSRLSWLYAIVGIGLLAGVLVMGRVTYGANLSITIAGISFQFSEFVKITVVLFMAGMLQERHDFHQVLIVTVIAAVHVGILALSADLGAALVYFVAYIVMVFVATRNPGYVVLGLGGMAGASVIAYKLFEHVRVRVAVWKDPFTDYEGTGYQIIQALFGVCAGGWFGTGLMNGHPDMIPLAHQDFTFAAICEEFGIAFAICLILLCMGMYLLIVNISMKLDKPFYRLAAIGLGTEYAFQVFLTIGGTTKFIPMTGITLPLISYGGSSIMCTIIMISIIQGLYIMRKDEDAEVEERERRQRAAYRRSMQEEYDRQQYGRPSDPHAGYPRRGADNAPDSPYAERNGRYRRTDMHPYQEYDSEENSRRNGYSTENDRDRAYGNAPERNTDELGKRIEQQTKEDLAFRNH